MANRTVPYPFLKWAGGKGRMIRHIIPRMPEKIKTYYEPFIGGGAVFFELARQKRFEKAVIADSSEELINAYSVIKHSTDALVKELTEGDYKYAKANYLRVRAINPKELSNVERAARMIYLARTCFNGLYRVNKEGGFNVPFGKYKNPVICDEPNLRAIAECLKNVKVVCADFESVLGHAAAGDTIYLDPPYIPTSNTSKFVNYSRTGFSEADHKRLAKEFRRLSEYKDTCVILSNSAAPLAYELYEGFDMLEVMGSRSVGGPAEYRKPKKEIIVYGEPAVVPTPSESAVSVNASPSP
jgi:DNA adenine methylase